MTNTEDHLSETLGAEFVLERTEHGLRIRTPHVHPDGDAIDVYYRKNSAGGDVVTDLGETVRWLRMQTPETKRSAQVTARIENIARSLGVEFHRGMLQSHVPRPEDAAQAVRRVTEAALHVSRGIAAGE